MKKIILFSFVFIAANIAKAQKLEKVKIDPISGDTTFATKPERIFIDWSGTGKIFELNAEKIIEQKTKKTVYCLNFYFSMKDYHFYNDFFKDSKVFLKLVGGKIITLDQPFNHYADYTTNPAGQQRTYEISETIIKNGPGPVVINAHEIIASYCLSQNELDDLKSYTTAFIRITSPMGPLDCDLDEDKAGIIQNQLILLTK